MEINENTEIEIIFNKNEKKKRKNTWFINFKKELLNSWNNQNSKGNYTIEFLDLSDDSFYVEVSRPNGSLYLKMTVFYAEKKIHVEKPNLNSPMIFMFKNINNMRSVCFNFICFR